MPRPNDWRPCSSAQVPMWRGETATCHCVAINCEDSISRASGSASPLFTTFSSPGLTGRRQRSAFLVRNPARCLRRYWNRWSWHPRRSVHLEKHSVADPVIEAFFGFDHGVGQRLLLLCHAKAPNYGKKKAFKDLAYYSEWPKVADAVIK